MDGTGHHRVEQGKPSSERQILRGFAHMQNLDIITATTVIIIK
jgi:hypothetical protein